MIIASPWALYNEIDEYAASWLENLIARGLIAPGVVDRRSIVDVRADDLRGFRQVHFFAGIGVWSYSLRRAGVSDDTALWTGSPPCQPFSAAGQRGGVDDERHLWPALFHLIGERRPERFFGEQVASKDGLGWLDLVLTDLEKAGYAVAALDTCSASAGAPHIRQRLRIAAYDLRSAAGAVAGSHDDEWWADISQRGSQGRAVDGRGGAAHELEHPDSGRAGTQPRVLGANCYEAAGAARADNHAAVSYRTSAAIGLDDGFGSGLEGLGHGHRAAAGQREGSLRPVATASGIDWVDNGFGDGWGTGRRDDAANDGIIADTASPIDGLAHHSGRGLGVFGDAVEPRQGGHLDGSLNASGKLANTASEQFDTRRVGATGYEPGSLVGPARHGAIVERSHEQGNLAVAGRNRGPSPTNGFWGDADWLFCRDGKWRPVEPGTSPLVDGAAFRVGSGSAFEGRSRQGMLKGYGNAIDAEATTDFIEAVLAHGRIEIDGDQARTVAADVDRTNAFEDLLG